MATTHTDFLSAKQVARLLNISRQAVQLRIHSGSLQAQKVGEYWAIPRSEVERILGKEAVDRFLDNGKGDA